MSKKRDQTAARIIGAVKEYKGLLTLAAVKAGVNYKTLWRYTQDYPSVAEAVKESKEFMLDVAEGKLFKAIQDGNMTAIIFFLKTKGKSRGYIERQEITGETGQPLKMQINVISDKAKELTEELIKDG